MDQRVSAEDLLQDVACVYNAPFDEQTIGMIQQLLTFKTNKNKSIKVLRSHFFEAAGTNWEENPELEKRRHFFFCFATKTLDVKKRAGTAVTPSQNRAARSLTPAQKRQHSFIARHSNKQTKLTSKITGNYRIVSLVSGVRGRFWLCKQVRLLLSYIQRQKKYTYV